jgi:integrase
METITSEPADSSGLDINALLDPKTQRGHTEHGWFGKGPRSFEWLLKHRVVRDWIDSYTSESTRNQRLYILAKVVKAGRLEQPEELLNLSDLQAKNLIKRVSQFYIQQGKSSYARIVSITMRLFYESHDREIKFKRSERVRSPRLKKINIEHIPTKAEVYRMADVAGSLRNRAIILSLYESGVRPNCLCNWNYGLVADQLYPEVKEPVQLKITPDLDTKLNLYGLPYYITFLGTESAQALRDHIEERKKRQGWSPKPSDRIFVTASSASRGKPLELSGVWEVVKFAAKQAGLDPKSIWPKVLRKSFRKTLNATETLDEDTKEALMGHRLPGSRGNYFDFHDIDEVREKYLRVDWSRDGVNGGKLKELGEANKDLEERVSSLENRNKELMIYMLAEKAGIVPMASPQALHRIPTEDLERALGQHVTRTGREGMQASAREASPTYNLGKRVGRKISSK